MNQSPENTRERNELKSAEVEHLEEVLLDLTTHTKQLERAGSAVDVSVEAAERVQKVIKRINSLLKVSLTGLALLSGVKVAEEVHSYSNSRYEITTEVGSDGTIEYSHEDAETTRILKFLTGAAELAPEDKVHFYRELLRSEIKKREELERALAVVGTQEDATAHEHTSIVLTLEEQSDLEKSLPMDEANLRQMLRDFYAEDDFLYFGEVQADIDNRVEKAFADAVEKTVEYDSALEKIVWNMQMKVGAPRIRWSAPEDNDFSKLAGHMAGAGRSMYWPSDNTIYITPGTTGADLVAENAHAKQFNDEPIESRVRTIIDGVHIAIRAVRENKSLHEAQFEQYETPGTIEHEAHEVIEPQLISEAEKEIKELSDER